MKSTPAQLRSRGYATENDAQYLIDKDESELLNLTNDPKPWVRTVAIRTLGHSRNTKYIPLIAALIIKEKKLYTKLEICNLLVTHGIDSLPYLLPLIGKIGKNQHKRPSLVDLKKLSFPLPRDLIVRVIIRIGQQALPDLEKILCNGDENQIYETIDAIGHIAYNYYDMSCEETLFKLLENKRENELIRCKIIRAFQAFSSNAVVEFLSKVVNADTNNVLVEEAKRSLFKIRKRKFKDFF